MRRTITTVWRERESGLSVGWSLAAQRETTSFIPVSSYFKLVCPGLPRCALVCPGLPRCALVCTGGARRLFDLIPILHAPNVPVSLPLPRIGVLV